MLYGAAGETRTPDRPFAKRLLFPTELRRLTWRASTAIDARFLYVSTQTCSCEPENPVNFEGSFRFIRLTRGWAYVYLTALCVHIVNPNVADRPDFRKPARWRRPIP